MLEGKNIILGITGGIAAYKMVEVASRLRKLGAEVHVIMTKEAEHFITRRTFEEITQHPVSSDMWAEIVHFNVAHISLAKLADLILVAPATANILAKASHGIADDILTTTLVATKAPVFFAPSMNDNMYSNVQTQKNIKDLETKGYHIIEPKVGHLACNVEGKGRLPEPLELVEEIEKFFQKEKDLVGKKVLITAAGTVEPIDPVRFIGNRSSGKMGYALAEEAQERGAEVILISAPSHLTVPANVRIIRVETALEMQKATLEEFFDSDIIIKAAAVADYRVKNIAQEKIKKNASELTLVLEKNPDILYELGQKKRKDQLLVGFAAETQNVIEYAKGKLQKKNLDYIVANDVSKVNAGFDVDTNIVHLIAKKGDTLSFPLLTKRELARKLFDVFTKEARNA